MRVRTMIMARVVWATLLLGWPNTLYRLMGGTQPEGRWPLVARVLGVRHVAEALLEWSGRPDRVRLAALVDTVHAASVVGFAVLDRPHRRVALADASVAGCFAGFGWLLADRS